VTLKDLQTGAGTRFLFHYTDAIRADAIIDERIFVSGAGAGYGVGIYATDIAPVGADTIDDVISQCFGGDAIPPEVSHAIAVRIANGPLRFHQTSDPYQWLLPTAKLEPVHIDGIYVAAVAFDGHRWQIIDADSDNHL
jgi:hypothetical protein